jgi:hypothetical protein
VLAEELAEAQITAACQEWAILRLINNLNRGGVARSRAQQRDQRGIRQAGLEDGRQNLNLLASASEDQAVKLPIVARRGDGLGAQR